MSEQSEKSETQPLPRLAAICTTWFTTSHTDVILRRWLKPRETDRQWGWTGARSQIHAVYLDQIHEEDPSEALCSEASIPIVKTVRDAMVTPDGQLAVDGVLIIGEHGEYPDNEFGQKLYPRKELFDQVVEVFKSCGKCVPVFNDKHLSWNVDWACEMVRTAERMGFPLLSGSSIPLTPKCPPVDLSGKVIDHCLTCFYQKDEIYGYHGIEFCQSLIENRLGGEAGIDSVTVYRGDEAWEQLEANPLYPHVIEHMKAGRDSNAQTPDVVSNTPHESVEDPELPTYMRFEHRDGLVSCFANLSGYIRGWATGFAIKGESKPIVTHPLLAGEALGFPHFATLSAVVQEVMLGESPRHLTQRVLTSTLATAYMMQARAKPGQLVKTPLIQGYCVPTLTPLADFATATREDGTYIGSKS